MVGYALQCPHISLRLANLLAWQLVVLTLLHPEVYSSVIPSQIK